MDDPTPVPAPRRRRWPLALSVLVGLVAAPFGYVAGTRISGPGMGWLMALNSAIFGALLMAGVVDRVLRLRGRRPDRG